MPTATNSQLLLPKRNEFKAVQLLHLLNLLQLGDVMNEGWCPHLHNVFEVKTCHLGVQGKTYYLGEPSESELEESKHPLDLRKHCIDKDE